MSDWSGATYAAVDVEGNGQQPPNLVELAVVPIDAGLVGAPVSWLVRPPLPITGLARRIHGITNEAAADRPPVGALSGEIRRALQGRVVVAHNAHVDVDVLARELPGWRPGIVIDTLRLSRKLLAGRVRSYRLGTLVDAFGLADTLPKGVEPHRATYDALMCARLFRYLASLPGGPDLITAQLQGDAGGALF